MIPIHRHRKHSLHCSQGAKDLHSILIKTGNELHSDIASHNLSIAVVSYTVKNELL